MAPSTSNLVGHPWENVFPTASSPFVSPGKYGPNFTAKYESCGGDCAAARDGTSSVMPIATAPRMPMTDFEFIDDPFNECRPGPRLCAGPPIRKGNHRRFDWQLRSSPERRPSFGCRAEMRKLS